MKRNSKNKSEKYMIETKKTIEYINETKSCFVKNDKTVKPLARLTKKKRTSCK